MYKSKFIGVTYVSVTQPYQKITRGVLVCVREIKVK